MADKFWTHLKLKNGDKVHFVPPAPNGDQLGGITQSERQAIGSGGEPEYQLLMDFTTQNDVATLSFPLNCKECKIHIASPDVSKHSTGHIILSDTNFNSLGTYYGYLASLRMCEMVIFASVGNGYKNTIVVYPGTDTINQDYSQSTYAPISGGIIDNIHAAEKLGICALCIDTGIGVVPAGTHVRVWGY